MKHKLFFLIVILFSCLSISSITFLACGDDDDDNPPNDLSGNWYGQQDWGNSTSEFSMELIQNGTTVTGTIYLPPLTKNIEEGTFNDNTLYFKVTFEHVILEFIGELVTSSRLEGEVTSTMIDNPDYVETGTWYAER